MDQASADVIAIGFSTKTCLPAPRAASVRSRCVETGVAMAMASMAGSFSTAEWSVVISMSG
jgi:hypothetical protein